MSAYRQPSKPERSEKTIVLPRGLVQRAILGVCLWFICFWFLIFPVMWVVEALVTGEGLWRLAVAPFAWLLVVWGIVRVMRFDQVMIRSDRIGRAGFLRDHWVGWKDVRGYEHRKKYRPRGRAVQLYAILTGDSELLVAPHIVVDPEQSLRWSLERAKEGDLAAIDDRVRSHGMRASAWPRRLTHLGVALALSVGVASLIWGTEKRREAERVLDHVADAPHEEQVAALGELLEDGGLEPSLRCRAGLRLMSKATRRGELERAAAVCQAMVPVGCDELRYIDVDCPNEPHAVLAQARTALDAGDPQRAIGLLGALRFQAAIRDALEVEALQASGSPAMARVVAERCVERYADAEDPVHRRFAERCRDAL